MTGVLFKMDSVSKICVILSAIVLITQAKKITQATEENCEVCVKFMTRFIDSLDSDTKASQEKVETAFRKLCKSSKKDDNRFCYYVGGLEESATGIVGEMSMPVSWGMPADKVCMKLYRKDEQICDLRYEKTLDLSTINFKKLKVKDLKQILSDWDATCKGCTEKDDFVKMVEELMPKHDPAAWEKRQKAEL